MGGGDGNGMQRFPCLEQNLFKAVNPHHDQRNKMQILNGSAFFFCFRCTATSALLTMNKNLTSYCWGHKARGQESWAQTNKPTNKQTSTIWPCFAVQRPRIKQKSRWTCAPLILLVCGIFWALFSGSLELGLGPLKSLRSSEAFGGRPAQSDFLNPGRH